MSSPILSSQEKQEWLFLLPKMTAEQVDELEKLLSVRMPEAKSVAAPPLTPARLRLRANSLAGGPPTRGGEVKKIIPPPKVGEARWGVKLAVSPKITPDIKPISVMPSDVESLKQVGVEAMRKAPSVYLFLEELGRKMKDLVTSRRATGEMVREAFEQSPLHRSYVSAGLKLMAGQESELLNHAEFEALADFRATLRKIL